MPLDATNLVAEDSHRKLPKGGAPLRPPDKIEGHLAIC